MRRLSDVPHRAPGRFRGNVADYCGALADAPTRSLSVLRRRDARCDFAGDSWQGNGWAEHRYRELRASGKRHPHAERILCPLVTGTHIIWRCWQDRTPYEPAGHTLQRLVEMGGLT